MSSWLKAAEDLFEVVDRRAKLVVSELAEDEQTDSSAPPTHPQGSKAKRSKSKGNRRHSADGPNAVKALKGQSLTSTPQLDIKSDEGGTTSVVLETRSLSDKSLEEKNDPSLSSDKDAPLLSTSSLEKQVDIAEEHVTNLVAVPTSQNASEAKVLIPSPNVEFAGENSKDVSDDCPPSNLRNKEIEETNKDSVVEAVQSVEVEESEVPAKVDQGRPQSETINDPRETEIQVKDIERVEPSADKKQQNDQKIDASTTPMKTQDPLDEAQMLLKSSVSTGKSKEARLSRVCNGLATRLQEYKSENAQLEELLVAERELSKSYEAHIKQLQSDMSASQKEVARIESSMAEALAAKNAEIESLSNSVDSLKKQLALSEGSLASMQANVESVMRNRELTETRMMQALREELASTERRAEEERAAHNATKKAAMEREVELEHRALEASTALARTQRLVDERTAKAAEFEQKLAFYEVENASLSQELQDVKALARRGQKKSPEEANQAIQMQAWQEEAERARQGQREAESKLSTLEVEMQKMRVELAAMKRDAEHYSRQEHMELEKRYRELTDLLYYKQTQLEAMASDKAAAEFQLEKEVKRLKEAQVEAERSKVSRRASSSWEDSDSEMKVLEPLPLHHRHMAAANIQLQKAAKFLDSGAVRATRFLWRYPLARLLLLFYLVFVHLFLMYLLHRLQEREDYDSAREIAESMGLANRTLP